MARFLNPLDIANRACQQCGVKRITSFTDGSQQAAEFNFNYDKLRDSELRRNTWTFATKLAALRPVSTASMTLVPAVWSAIVPYAAGSIVDDGFGNFWSTSIVSNLGNQPGSLADTTWEIWFGPRVVQPYSQFVDDTSETNTYYAGEVVYTTDSQGHYFVFVSTQNSNGFVPTSPAIYDPTVSYMQGNVVSFAGWDYISLFNWNLNNEPDLTPQPWQSTITYALAATVLGIDGKIYYSTISSNVGNNPTGGVGWATYGILGAWAPNFNASTISLGWTRLAATLAQLNVTYPLGCGPIEQTTTRNIYQLPNGFLRLAPQSPKSGSTSYLGAPSGYGYLDWEVQDGYIVTEGGEAIILRFVADVQQVSKFDPMFCEGLAARMGFETVERLTDAAVKRQVLSRIYQEFMSDARQVNGIEDGAVEPPIDDYISARA